MKTPDINYQHLFLAQKHYADYQTLSVPWVVSEQIINFTLPPNSKAHKLDNNKYLVGSAEQSFLSLVLEQKLKGSFQALTPCFRDDPEDDLHYEYFMKLELFDNQSVNGPSFARMMRYAHKFFEQFFEVEQVETKDSTSIYSFDIVDAKFGIELGSYGKREHDLLGPWLYGTGCAEPRLSQVIKKYQGF